MRTCAYQGVRNAVFWKIWHALFSWNTRFEICPFALLLTMSVIFEFFVLIERQDSSDLDRSPLNMVLKIAWLVSILEIAHGDIAQSFMQWNDMCFAVKSNVPWNLMKVHILLCQQKSLILNYSFFKTNMCSVSYGVKN